MKSRKIKVGDLLIARKYHRVSKNPSPISANKLYKVIEIVNNKSNPNRYTVRIQGQCHTYCPDWFDLSKEHNVRELLSKLEGHEI